MNLDEINEISSKLDDISISFEDRLDNLKFEVWLRRTKLICNICNSSNKNGGAVSSYSSKITYNNLRTYLLEGYTFLSSDTLKFKVKEKLKALETVVSKVENKLSDIYTIKDVSVLENMDTTFMDLIDLSNECIEYKAMISVNSNHKQILDSIVGKYYAE